MAKAIVTNTEDIKRWRKSFETAPASKGNDGFSLSCALSSIDFLLQENERLNREIIELRSRDACNT